MVGNMAIYRKKTDGVWYFSVYVSGRKKRLRGSCGTSVKAEAQMVEQTIRMAAGRKSPKEHVLRLIEALYADETPQDKVPVSAIMFEYERLCGISNKRSAVSSVKIKRYRVSAFARWCEDEFPAVDDIRDVSRICAQQYVTFKLGRASVKTVRNIVGDLSSVWNELKRAHDGIDNPWPLAMPQKGEDGRREVFTAEEAERIFEAGDADGHGWGIAARISACTGLRMGDVVTLRHEDIVDGVLRLRPRKTARHGITTVLPLPPDVLSLIGSGTGPIMPDLADGYSPSTNMRFPFARILRACGLDTSRYTFHSFRHYFRTRLAEAGVSDDMAKRLGGWTVDSTARHYDHDDHRAELAAAINAAWNVTSSPS